ncbi:Aspartic peptidase domain containing protein [Tylopilus felleus]
MTLLKWRRTLNEVMEEREACRNAKIRKQSSSGGKLEVEVSVNVSQAALLLSAKMVSTLRYAQSSPPRPLFRSDWMAALLPPSTCQPSAVPGTAISNLPVTTPARTALSTSTSTTSPTKNPLKNFVVPGWARTSTAMLPQLSEEALARQRAEQEAKEAQMSLRRREAAKAKLSRKALLYHHPHHLLCPWSLWMQSNLYRRPRPSQIDNPGFPLFQAHRQEICPSRVSTVSHAQQVWLLLAIHAVGQRPRVIIHSQHTKRYSTSHPSDCHPRSPTVLHRSGVRKSPQKGAMQTPWTPMHSGANLQSPRSLCSLGNPLFKVTLAPGLVITGQSIGSLLSSSIRHNVCDILGLGPVGLTKGLLHPKTNALIPTVMNNLKFLGLVTKKVFSVYLPPIASTGPNKINGKLTYGGIDTSSGYLMYLPLTKKSPASENWGIKLSSCTYGSDTFIPQIPVAGSSTLLPRAIPGAKFDTMVTMLTEIPPSSIQHMQPLHLRSGDHEFTLDVDSQLLPQSMNTAWSRDAGKCYSFVVPIGHFSGQGLDFVLGIPFLEKYYTVYNGDKQQIGFTPVYVLV